jgi:hypothetical protein
MDIKFEFEIHGVPNATVAEDIRRGIQLYLLDNHQTDMYITFEDVT